MLPCNYTRKWLDFQVLSDEDYKPEVPSHNPFWQITLWDVKEPTYYSQRVGHEVAVVWPSVSRGLGRVIYLVGDVGFYCKLPASGRARQIYIKEKNHNKGGVRVAVMRYFWHGFAEIFILACGIAVFQE